ACAARSPLPRRSIRRARRRGTPAAFPLRSIAFRCSSLSVAQNTASAADAVVSEPSALHHLGIVEIAAIEQHRRFQRRMDTVELGTAERLPFGDYRQRIGFLQGGIGFGAQFQIAARSVNALRFLPRYRIERTHARTGL